MKKLVCVTCAALLVANSTAVLAAPPVPPVAAGQLAGAKLPWGDVDFDNDLGWAQFAAGPLPDGTRFEVELTISNTHPTEAYGGELRLADTNFFPIEGIEVVSLDPDTGEVLGIRPAFFALPFIIAALGTVKWRFVAESGVVNPIIGFLLLHAVLGSNEQLVTTFAYVLLGASGLVIDRIPILPILAASLFQFTYCRLAGLTTGIAVVALASLLLRLRVYYDQGSEKPQGEVFETLIQVPPGQRTFFPEQVIPSLPGEIGGSLVTIEFLTSGGVAGSSPALGWIAALDVTSAPQSEAIQIASKQVRSERSESSSQ